MDEVALDGRGLTLEQVEAVARRDARVSLAPAARDRMAITREKIEARVAAGEVIYGVNTGFGRLADVHIPAEQLAQLQKNLLRSHACGVGEPFPEDVVRAMLLLRANVLAGGYAGARPLVAERLIDLLNARVHPVVPCQGSVGASGDLAPLAHLALVLIGEGEALLRRAADLRARRRWPRAGPSGAGACPKEGLALINGTQVMAAVAALALLDAERLTAAADVVAAMSVDAMEGTDTAFLAEIHEARRHPGQLESARHLWALLQGSEIRDAHQTCSRVQDAYSLRCTPQVHGDGARRARPPAREARGRDQRRHRQPDGAARRPRRLGRQLPRRPGGGRLRLRGDRARRARLDLRAPFGAHW